MKTSELSGAALDWAVAKITNPEWWNDGYMTGDPIAALDMDDGSVYSPSTDWAQGGPIIERENMCVHRDDSSDEWEAHRSGDDFGVYWGSTPLIAAMRCYVASMLGDEVEIPATISETV